MRSPDRPPQTWSPLRLLAASAMAAGLGLTGACADLQRANFLAPDTINPASPVAEDARLASAAHFPPPTFRDIPPKPKDVPTAATYKSNVVAVVDQRRRIAAWRAAHPAMVDNTEPWAVEQRAQLPPSATEPVAASHEAESKAFADRLRREANAPPKPQ